MASIFSRKLLSNYYYDYTTTTTTSLCSTKCEPGSDGYEYCVISNCTVTSPPPPPSPQPVNHPTHVTPYLIAIVCILGVAFLLISTCTILLRTTRSRRSRPVSAITAMTMTDRDHDLSDEGRGLDYPIWNIVTVGLQQSLIDQIAVFRYEKNDTVIEGKDCSVCLTEFEDGEELRLLPKCSHAFHLCCIDTWLRAHKNCPLCRAPIMNESRSGEMEGDSRDRDPAEVSQVENEEVGEFGAEAEMMMRERVDQVECVVIGDVSDKDRGLTGVVSDLGERDRGFGDDYDDVRELRRSVSMDASAAAVITTAAMAMAVAFSSEGGCSEEWKMKDKDSEGEKAASWVEEPSAGCSSQKATVSMKRSVSSPSVKFFSSFRRSRSQISSLPL